MPRHAEPALANDETKTIKDRELYMIGYVIDDSGVKYFHDTNFSSSISSIEAITYNSFL